MQRKIMKNEVYKHFKGNIYKVLDIATNTETLNKMVIYENIKTKEIWARDYDMFISEVDKNKYPDVVQKYRFEKIDNDN